MYHSIYFGSKNTWTDFHLIPTSRPLVNPPEVQTNYVDVPGKNGSIDYTEILHGVRYKDREGSWEFIVANGYGNWYERYSEIMSFVHGKYMVVRLEDDPTYYYQGRLSVDAWASNEHWSTIVIKYRLEPFKKKVGSSSEDGIL